MPGLLLCFVLRYDAYKKSQLHLAETGLPPPNHLNKLRYLFKYIKILFIIIYVKN